MRRKRHLTLLKGDPIAQPTMTPAADETVEHDEQVASVQEALNTLTPRDREILLLWDAGLSYPEIAAQTGQGAPPSGGRARPTADQNGDRCGTFLRTSSTPTSTRG